MSPPAPADCEGDDGAGDEGEGDDDWVDGAGAEAAVTIGDDSASETFTGGTGAADASGEPEPEGLPADGFGVGAAVDGGPDDVPGGG